jgi:hypothetical protein
MTEQEWLTSTDPAPMLEYLREMCSERKMRLLACACCRQIWDHLPDPRSKRAVEVAERFADDQATPRELADARNAALAVTRRGPDPAWAAYWAANVKAAGPLENTFDAAGAAGARQAAQKASGGRAEAWTRVHTASVRDQVELVFEVIGNPFRQPWLNPLWRGWEGGVLVQLAEGIYNERAFDRMPILGDALEEAGCADKSILDHCRGTTGHVRGCWVLDWLLEKS